MSALQLNCSDGQHLAPRKLAVASDGHSPSTTKAESYFSLLCNSIGSDAAHNSLSWPDSLCLAHKSVSECRESLSFSPGSLPKEETEPTQLDSPSNVACIQPDVSAELFSLSSPAGDNSTVLEIGDTSFTQPGRSTPREEDDALPAGKVSSPSASLALFSDDTMLGRTDVSSPGLCNGQPVPSADARVSPASDRSQSEGVPPSFLPSFCSTPSRGDLSEWSKMSDVSGFSSKNASTCLTMPLGNGLSNVTTPDTGPLRLQTGLRWSKSLETPIDSQYKVVPLSPDTCTTDNESALRTDQSSMANCSESLVTHAAASVITPCRPRQPHGRILFTGDVTCSIPNAAFDAMDRASVVNRDDNEKPVKVNEAQLLSPGPVSSQDPHQDAAVRNLSVENVVKSASMSSGIFDGSTPLSQSSTTGASSLVDSHFPAATNSAPSQISSLPQLREPSSSAGLGFSEGAPSASGNNQPATSSTVEFATESGTAGVTASGSLLRHSTPVSQPIPVTPVSDNCGIAVPHTPISDRSEQAACNELFLFSERSLFADTSKGVLSQTSRYTVSPAQKLSSNSVVQTSASTSAPPTSSSPNGTPQQRGITAATAPGSSPHGSLLPTRVGTPFGRPPTFSYPRKVSSANASLPPRVVYGEPRRGVQNIPKPSSNLRKPAAPIPHTIKPSPLAHPMTAVTPKTAKTVVETSNKSGPASFRMLSGRSVQLSDEALKEAKKIIEDLEDPEQRQQHHQDRKRKSTDVGTPAKHLYHGTGFNAPRSATKDTLQAASCTGKQELEGPATRKFPRNPVVDELAMMDLMALTTEEIDDLSTACVSVPMSQLATDTSSDIARGTHDATGTSYTSGNICSSACLDSLPKVNTCDTDSQLSRLNPQLGKSPGISTSIDCDLDDDELVAASDVLSASFGNYTGEFSLALSADNDQMEHQTSDGLASSVLTLTPPSTVTGSCGDTGLSPSSPLDPEMKTSASCRGCIGEKTGPSCALSPCGSVDSPLNVVGQGKHDCHENDAKGFKHSIPTSGLDGGDLSNTDCKRHSGAARDHSEELVMHPELTLEASIPDDILFNACTSCEAAGTGSAIDADTQPSIETLSNASAATLLACIEGADGHAVERVEQNLLNGLEIKMACSQEVPNGGSDCRSDAGNVSLRKVATIPLESAKAPSLDLSPRSQIEAASDLVGRPVGCADSVANSHGGNVGTCGFNVTGDVSNISLPDLDFAHMQSRATAGAPLSSFTGAQATGRPSQGSGDDVGHTSVGLLKEGEGALESSPTSASAGIVTKPAQAAGIQLPTSSDSGEQLHNEESNASTLSLIEFPAVGNATANTPVLLSGNAWVAAGTKGDDRAHVEDEEKMSTTSVAGALEDCPGRHGEFTGVFRGFATAKGRAISVSEKALAHARSLMNDGTTPAAAEKNVMCPVLEVLNAADLGITFEGITSKTLVGQAIGKGCTDTNNSSVNNNHCRYDPKKTIDTAGTAGHFPGFATASGRAVVVSEESMKCARALLSDDNAPLPAGESSNVLCPEASDVAKEAARHVCNTSDNACSAGGCDSVASAAASCQGEVVPDSTMKGTEAGIHSASYSLDKAKTSMGMASFATPRGRRITISAESLKLAHALMSDGPAASTADSGTAAGFAGINTTAGEVAIISKRTMELAQSLIGDDAAAAGESVKHVDQFPGSGAMSSVDECQAMVELTTATGRNVAVSDESMERAHTFVEDNAAGHKVSVSEEAIRRAHSLVGDDTTLAAYDTVLPVGIVTTNNCNTPAAQVALGDDAAWSADAHRLPTHFDGFATAGGRKVTMSEEAMKHARTLTTDDASALSSNVDTPTGFGGFATAGGRKEAIKHARALMTDDGSAPSSEVNKAAGFDGFATAGGRKVRVSEEAMKRARALMTDDASALSSDVDTPTGFGGFATAGGRKVTVSEEAMKRARALMPDDGSAPSSEVNKAAGFDGFATAGGRKVIVSEEAMKRARTLMTDDGSAPSSEVNKAAGFGGFATAGGRKVRVSEEAMKRACALMTDDGSAPSSEVNKAAGFDGFATAGGRKVTVSEEAMKRARALMTDDASALSSNVDTPTGFGGFATAGGRKVTVSEEAIKRARALMTDDGSAPSSEVNKAAGFDGFATAGGRKVRVSEEAMKRARALMTDDGSAPSSEVSKAAGFDGFATAGGRKVTVSEEAMKRAQSLLSSDDTPSTDGGRNPVAGFATASGRKVNVSETAMKHARNLMADERASPPYDTQHTLSKIFLPTTKGYDSSLHTPASHTVANSHFTVADTHSSLGDEERKTPANFEMAVDRQGSLSRNMTTRKPNSSALGASPILSGSASSVSGNRKGFRPVLTTPSEFLRDRSVGLSRVTPQRCLPRESRTPTSTGPLSRNHTPAGKTRQSVGGNPVPFNTPFRQVAPRNTPKSLPKTQSVADKENVLSCTGKTKSSALPHRPQIGLLLQARQTGKRIRRCSISGVPPQSHSKEELLSFGVAMETLNVNCISATSFSFEAKRFFSTRVCEEERQLQIADGGLLEIADGMISISEIERAFFSTPGVVKSLISPEWVRNHYRWIVWSLAAQEVSFPMQLGGRLLTPENVLLRLKYRYDREVDRCQRSALKKIYELDDRPGQAMVLCVASIIYDCLHTATATAVQSAGPTPTKPARPAEITTPASVALPVRAKTPKESPSGAAQESSDPLPAAHVTLTDGWYSIPAVLDVPLLALVRKQAITVGSKLFMYGAEFTGTPQASPPLQAPSSTCLKLGMNSTRRARWDATLGFQHCRTPFTCNRLCSLSPNGGRVPLVDVLVQRKYPVLWMEKDATTGRCVFRNSRAEERMQHQHSLQQEACLEKIYDKVRNEIEEGEDSQGAAGLKKCARLSAAQLASLETGSQLYSASKNANDPESFAAELNETQRAVLNSYQQRLMEKRQLNLRDKLDQAFRDNQQTGLLRNVSSLLCVRLVGLSGNPSSREGLGTILSVWRPSEDIEQLLEEGRCLRITSLGVSPPKVNRFSGPVQLTALRNTRYDVIEDANVTKHKEDLYVPRQVTDFGDLEKYKTALLPPFQELDVVGVVVLVSTCSAVGDGDRSAHMPLIFLANGNHQLVALKFWSSLKDQAVDDLLVLGKAVSACNLQWSARQLGVPTLRANELSTFSSNPRQPHVRTALDCLELSASYVETMSSCAQDVLALRNNTIDMASQTLPRQHKMAAMAVTPTGPRTDSTTDGYSVSSSGGGHSQPARFPGKITTSSVVASVKRKHKSDALDAYPSPPPLFELPCKPSPGVLKEFKTPSIARRGT